MIVFVTTDMSGAGCHAVRHGCNFVCMAGKLLITQSSLLPDTQCLTPASPCHPSAEGELKRETCIIEAMCGLMDYGW